MSAMEYFLLGVMVSWTPSLIVLAWLVRPALNLNRDLENNWIIRSTALNGGDGSPSQVVCDRLKTCTVARILRCRPTAGSVKIRRQREKSMCC